MKISAVKIIIPGLLVAMLCGLWPASSMAATPAEVDRAIEQAKEYLYSKQRNGNWENSPTRQGNGNADTSGAQWGGLTSIATYALLAAGESPQEPRLAQAIEFLLDADIIGTYAMGLRMQVWHHLPRSEKVRAAIRRDAILLMSGARPPGAADGMFHYILNAGGGFDHSCSNYGVLGLWAAGLEGLEIPTAFWERVDKGWRKGQQKDGGWVYTRAPRDGKDENIGLTAAGVATLFVTQDFLNRGRGGECKGNLRDPDIDRGLAWLADGYDRKIGHSGRRYYAMYNVERAGVASGYKYFGTTDWYAHGADYLVKSQRNGAWGALHDTCFGIFFLTRGRAPVLMNKLEYGIDMAGDRQKLANWNQRPRDLANLSNWVSNQTERTLNWQIVNLNVDPDEWLDSPILFIAGDQNLNFGAEGEAKLKKFIEDGGLILGNADCGSRNFADSFRRIGQKLFPAYEFRALPANHPIMVGQQFNLSSKGSTLNLMGLSNGVRELMLLIPHADPSKAWQMQTVGGKEELHQIAANIFLYAIDRRNLRNKGDTYVVQPNKSISPTRQIKLARLQYAGNWDPEPAGWRRLGAILRNDQKVDLQVAPIKLGEGKLKDYRLAHLTGTGQFRLSDTERGELKSFIDSGGLLIVDAAGGAATFTESLENELKELFPRSAVPLPVLKPEHPIFSSPQKIQDVEYRSHAKRILGNLKTPQLRALERDGRVLMFVSHEDLSGGLVGEPVDGVHGYEPKSATALMTNIVLFAAAQPALAPAPASAPATMPASAPAIAPASAPARSPSSAPAAK